MNYLALARKWRPRTFSELIGQEHLKKVLINSLEQNRLHHAYLFTGTRGVGKTSIARLFAKALNCEQGITSNPCLKCNNCIAIEQGSFIDLIEVDGASRTRVEDTRELLENIQYIPSIGQYKIYIIDEVHMLSNHSCNALLKTLEEPPEHVKFFLATTDPQKLPITILSRCLQFHLKPLNIENIVAHLQKILKAEEFKFELASLQLIAKAAKGSVRDALSILDQAIAGCSNKTLITDDIKDLLGYSQQDYALQLIQALSAFNLQQLIRISRQIASEGAQYSYVFEELIHYFHQISIYQLIPDYDEFQLNVTELQPFAKQLTPEDIQLFYQIAVKGYEEMHLAPTPAIAFEMTLLRMCAFIPAKSIPTPPTMTFENNQSEFIANVNTATSEHIIQDNTSVSTTLNQSKLLKLNPDSKINDTLDNWSNIVPQLNLTGLTLTAAEHASLISKTDLLIKLQVSKGHLSLFTDTIVKRIEKALSEFYNEKLKVQIEATNDPISTPAEQKRIVTLQNLQEAENAIKSDIIVQELTQQFSAEIVKNSISPAKNSLQLELEGEK